jgi:hypothetical protein
LAVIAANLAPPGVVYVGFDPHDDPSVSLETLEGDRRDAVPPTELVLHVRRDIRRNLQPVAGVEDRRHRLDPVPDRPQLPGVPQHAVGPAREDLAFPARFDQAAGHGNDGDVPGRPEDANEPERRSRRDGVRLRRRAIHAVEQEDRQVNADAPHERDGRLRGDGLVKGQPPAGFRENLLQACRDARLGGAGTGADQDVHGGAQQAVCGRERLHHRRSARRGRVLRGPASRRGRAVIRQPVPVLSAGRAHFLKGAGRDGLERA